MISEKLENAFNGQINKEIFSAYLYLSMSAYLSDIGLNGFANWMKIQYQEEMAHAMGLYDYLIERGGTVKLDAIDKPQTAWKNVTEVFEATLEHEKYVTSLINGLADVADEVKDRAAAAFLQWYINEQVEEEANATDTLCKLKLINGDGNALFMLDKDMGARVFNPPVIG